MATNPIQNYIKDRIKGNVKIETKVDQPVNPIKNYIRSSIGGKVSPTTTSLPDTTTYKETKEPEKEKVDMTLWQKISKQLMKPVGVVAAETENLAQIIAPGGETGTVPGKRAFDVLSGKEESSWTEVLKDNKKNLGIGDKTANILGFAMDIVVDPINLIGGGLTKTGKLADLVTSGIKAGETIEKGSVIDKAIKASGKTIEELTLLGTKAEQAKAGQRAFLKIGGGKYTGKLMDEKVLVKGTGIYDKFGKVAKAVGTTKPSKMLKEAFSTKTGMPELDAVIDKFKNLGEYKKTKVIDQATKIQKVIKDMAPQKLKMVAEAIERPLVKDRIKDKEVLNLADNLESLFKTMKGEESKLGVLKTSIEDYFPRIKAKDTFGERIKAFFNPKSYNATLKNAKERKILKLADETGNEIIGNYKKLGLRKINQGVMRDAIEKETAKKTETLQRALETLTKDDVNLLTGDLQSIIDTLKKNISKTPKLVGGSQDLVEPTVKELDDIVKSIVWPKRDEMNALIKDLEDAVKTSQGKEFLKPPIGFTNSKNAKIKWLSDELIKTQNRLSDKLRKIENFDLVGAGGKLYKNMPTSIDEINKYFGKEFFSVNPAVAYATRGLASAKATTAKEFLEEVSQKFFMNAEDAPAHFVESTNPILKGLKAEPEVVKAIDKYVTGIQPKEMNEITKAFDKIQNFWKAQALISPSYHVRNQAGNLWANHLADVDMVAYKDAIGIKSGEELNKIVLLTDAGKTLTRGQIKELAQKTGVIGEGLFGAEIEQALKNEISSGSWKPWEQNNKLFKFNKKIGEAIEDHARIAHFIDRLKKGYSAEDAAKSVKKYLFDYSDLTDIEKNVFKRIAPFYTWTRKAIPLNLENLLVKPAKFSQVAKAINSIESGVPEPETEKYMSSYLKDNIPLRIRENKDGNTEYFLLSSWLPATSAIDFLSQPFENMINMVTPVAKSPLEWWGNKSLFFRNTLGESSKLEYYEKQPTEFISIPMRKKTAHLMRNVRIFNDINKVLKEGDADDPDNSNFVKALDVLFGHSITYDVSKSRKYYQRDTDERIRELTSAIKSARKQDNDEYADKLIKDLRKFKKERGR